MARLLYYVEWPDGAAIIMEAVPGRSLRHVLNENDNPLAPEAALTILKGSLLGLATAHTAGVVHRDYKPANVLVQDDGQSKLIDFGIAVLSGQGDKSGTPAYMAPEQWKGEPATSATDLYAATCVFLECITGKKPFQATTLDELRTKHIKTRPSLEGIPETLHPLIERGIAKSPSERFWSAADFVAQLEAVAVRSYGPDWERRGLVALGTLAAIVATAVPLSIFGSAVLAPGVSGLGAGAGAGSGAVASGAASQAASAGYIHGTATADVVAKATGSTSKGFLSKVGGAKGITGIGAVGAGAVAVGWLFWPSAPGVGGESSGAVHASFTRPGVLLGQPNMPAAETPYMDLKISVTPARAKTGSSVRVVTHFEARTPAGALYLPEGERRCFGENDERSDIYDYSWSIGKESQQAENSQKDDDSANFVTLYQIPSVKSTDLPKADGKTVHTNTKVSDESQPYVKTECAYLSSWTDTRTFKITDSSGLAPGRYLVSPIGPVQIVDTVRAGEEIDPQTAGGITEGSLPVLEVLEDG
ncbi:hypothetical protein H4W34_004062 [Actinomadura algeriensis]|uniref:Protein kinase domain-containing protein n=1 Tax=Actinomadura algeriensis TaxID=1679523 RepID=A0ABR9JUI5_9ACTN|nr:hypothetical protein [Actinomadura algeriensis]